MSYKTELVGALDNALTLLLDREHWCQHAMAKNTRGRIVEARSRDACSFCLVGAIIHYTTDKHELPVWFWLDYKIRQRSEFLGAISFNDDEDTTHEMVIDMLRQLHTDAEQIPDHFCP